MTDTNQGHDQEPELHHSRGLTPTAPEAARPALETLARRMGKLTALLRVVRAAAGSVGEVNDDTWHAALAAGWSEVDLS